ncbi:MAG: DNA polymerase IV [Eubacteriales bacterium]|nr:DNA polymerase IV [Eubacteriales bacterium]
MPDRIIFHIDVNSAFLSWEAVRRLQQDPGALDLRMVSSAVGGDLATRHGVILAKSIPAKKYGVRTGEPVVDALRKCPDLLLVKPDHAMYREQSRLFIEILRRYSPDVEQFSVDEAFVDMTGTRALFGEPPAAARRIADEIRDTLGFTVNVGVSSNKLLAKMASDFEKPDKVHTLFPSEIGEKMWPMPVRELFFVGRASEERLRTLGIRTIGDLARADIITLRRFFGKHGEVLWNFANGRDSSPVETQPQDNKGYGNSVTLAENAVTAREAKAVLLDLSEKVAQRLRADGVRIETVSVTIRYADFTENSHQMALTNATDITDELYSAACRLFDELWDGAPIRLLGVSTGRVLRGSEGRQLSLFDTTDYEKLERLDHAMDDIRRRFGRNAVRRASVMERENPKK